MLAGWLVPLKPPEVIDMGDMLWCIPFLPWGMKD